MKKMLLILLLIIPSIVFSLGDQESKEADSNDEQELVNENIITVTGLIRLVGSEPLAQFIIETESGEIYYLPPAYRRDNPGLINSTITVQGELEVIEMVTVDGKYRHVENHLKNIIIID